jgi:predicted nucleic acid-binding protein
MSRLQRQSAWRTSAAKRWVPRPGIDLTSNRSLHEVLDEGLGLDDATADLIPGAVIAAVAAEHGCTVATLDRDFARFPSVPHKLLARL